MHGPPGKLATPTVAYRPARLGLLLAEGALHAHGNDFPLLSPLRFQAQAWVGRQRDLTGLVYDQPLYTGGYLWFSRPFPQLMYAPGLLGNPLVSHVRPVRLLRRLHPLQPLRGRRPSVHGGRAEPGVWLPRFASLVARELDEEEPMHRTAGRFHSHLRVVAWTSVMALPAMAVAAAPTPAAAPAKPAAATGAPAVTLPPLPWAKDALEPHITAKTMSFHYDKHHRGYLDNLNKLLAGKATPRSLEQLILDSAGQADQSGIFNNAAQVWNHTFFWKSMKKGGGGTPKGALLARITTDFGSFDKLKAAFVAAGVGQFGSGWVWLVEEGKTLKIVATANADTPLAHGQRPLLTCDVWEHAYYLDYQNRRKDFVQVFLDHLVNWEFAASQLK